MNAATLSPRGLNSDTGAAFALRIEIRGDVADLALRCAATEAAVAVLVASGHSVQEVIEGSAARSACARGGPRPGGRIAEAGAALSIARMAAASILGEAQPDLVFELLIHEHPRQ